MTPRAPAIRENIQASAGSGKTYALTGRYLQLLLSGIDPRTVLATTFTRKAAGEILDRVLSSLAAVVLDASKLEKLAAQVGLAGLTHAEVVEAFDRLVRQMHRLRVGTLDAVFAQLASSYAFELHLTPGWRIADNLAGSQLVREALRDVLAERNRADAARLLRLLAHGDAQCSIAKEVGDLIEGLHRIYVESTESAWSKLPTYTRLTEEELSNLVARVMTLDLPESLIDPHAKAMALLADMRYAEFLKQTIVKGACTTGKYDGKPIPRDLLEGLSELARHAEAVCLGRIRDYGMALHELLQAHDARLRELLFERGLMRFDDVTRAVAEAHLPGDADAALRLDELVEHLLLDEVQDTSLPQWRALAPWVQRITSGDVGSLVCVGDVKQAIHGFRGGEAGIAESLPTTLPGLAARDLLTSYRSSQVVIDVVNKVFQDLPRNPALNNHAEAAAAWSAGFKHHETALDIPGYAVLRVAPDSGDSKTQPEVTLRYAAEELAESYKKHPERTWGVLIPTNKGVARIIYQLRELGVPASEEGESRVNDSPAVAAALAAMTFADHPGDTIARFHVGNTVLGRAFDLEPRGDAISASRASRRLRSLVLERGYGGAMAEIRRILAPVCQDPADLRRLSQLVEMAYAYEDQATLRPRDFVRFVENQPVEDPSDTARVRVMTIHKAKGLEFDAVLLAGLDSRMTQSPKFVWRRESPTGKISLVCPYVADSLKRRLPIEFQRLHDEHEQREMRERLCGLYVAVTRARYALHIVVAPSKNDKVSASFGGVLRAALAPEHAAPPLATLYEAGQRDWADTAPVVDELPHAASRSFSPITLAPRPKRRRHAPRLSPSESQTVILARELQLDEGMRRGGVLAHAALEAIGWIAPGDEGVAAAIETARAALAGFGAIPREAQSTLELLQTWLTVPQIRELFDKDAFHRRAAIGTAHRTELLRERAFAMWLDDRIVEGRIDRLAAAYSGDQALAAEVVDFKTGKVDRGATIESLAAKHREQMEPYRQAAGRMLSLDPSQIAVRVAFMEAGLVVGL